MRLESFLVWKHWASSPLRIILTLLGVALGVAVVVSIHVLDHNTILSQLERKRWDYGRVDLELAPLEPVDDLAARRDRLAARADLARVGLIVEAEALLRGAEAQTRARLFGLAPPGEGLFGHYRVAEGRDLTDLDPADRVLVGMPLARELGLRPGSVLEAQALPRAAAARCVEGRLVPAAPSAAARATWTVQGILEPLRLARQAEGRVIIGAFALARPFAEPFLPRFQVARAPGVDPDRLIRSLEKEFHVDDARTALIGEAADERAFRNGVKVLGCLALVLGMFVIFHTLSHALAEKIRTVGILRSLGATQAQVNALFLADALALSLAGTAAGVLLGIGLARLLAALKVTTLGLGKPVLTFELPWGPVGAIAGLGILFTLLGAAFPLLKVRGLSPRRILHARDLAPPADLMRGVNLFLFALLVLALPAAYLAMTPLLGDAGGGAGAVLFQAVGLVALFFSLMLLSPRLVRRLGRLPLLLARRFWPLAAFLVQKNLLRSPGRLSTAVCGLTLVSLALVGVRSLTGALKGEIREYAAKGLRGRLFVHCDPVGPDLLPALRAVPGVAAVLPLEARVSLPFLVIGTDAAELARNGGPLAGRPELVEAMRERRGLLVSSRLANLRDLHPGRRIPVPTGAGLVHYQVAALSDGAGFFPDERAFALADRRWLHLDFCADPGLAGRFEVRLERGANPAAAAAGLEALLAPYGKVAWIRTGEGIEHEHLHDVDRDFLFFDILLGLLLLLAGTGQMNLITLTALAREREIGVLRALGMTRRDFLAVLLLEAGVVGLLAALLTLAAGAPLGIVLVRGLRQVSGLETPFALPWEALLFAAGIGLAVSLLSALLPALRATGRPPAWAVRSTE